MARLVYVLSLVSILSAFGFAQDVQLNAVSYEKLPSHNQFMLHAMRNRYVSVGNRSLPKIFETGSAFETNLEDFDLIWKLFFEGLADNPDENRDDMIVVEDWKPIDTKNLLRADTTKVLPGDLVILRNGSQPRNRVLVYAGEGKFDLGSKDLSKRGFSLYYYPFSLGSKRQLPHIQLNSYPPRINRSIESAISSGSEASKSTVKALPEKSYNSKWLTANIEPSKKKGIVQVHFLPAVDWKTGTQVKVVRRKNILVEFNNGSRERDIENALKKAISLCTTSSKKLKVESLDSATRLNIERCFGIKEPTLQHRKEIARVFDKFNVDMVKAVIGYAPYYEDLGIKKPPGENPNTGKTKAVLASVDPDARFVIAIQARFFNLSEDQRAATLIHEFCHCIALHIDADAGVKEQKIQEKNGHPGTWDYGGRLDAINKYRSEELNQSAIASTWTPHRMLHFSSRKGEASGYLRWSDSRINAYSYGYFALWNSK